MLAELLYAEKNRKEIAGYKEGWREKQKGISLANAVKLLLLVVGVAFFDI